MRLSKLLLAAVGATVLLGALVSSASARNLSTSSQTIRMFWSRMDFRGGFGTVECELILRGSLHTRTSTKTLGSLIGFITEGNVPRCARGSATISIVSFPWHRRYRGFTGTLPSVSTVSDTITGAEWTIREPFGITCGMARESTSTIATYALTIGIVSSAALSGEGTCGGLVMAFSGSTTNVVDGSGTRLTVTLI